jgi:TolB-like protein
MNETPEPVGLWEELKRRHVVRVGTVYAVVSWLAIQVADVTFENFGIPDWAFRFIVIILLIGFPVSLILAWALELTPEGIRRTPQADESKASAASTPGHSGRRKRFSALFAAAVPTVLFGTLALVFFFQREPAPQAEATVAPQAMNIAVLPLLNMSTLADNAYFAGGLHEDILTELSRLEGFEVVSRTSVMPYLASDKSLSVIAEELKADYVVEGSVRRADDHVRVTVQLIQADNDRHVWADNFDREVLDEFATQSAIARDISQSIHRELKPDAATELVDLPTDNVRAYDLYHQARTLFRTEPETEAVLLKQRELLEDAVEADPEFVEAWAELNAVLDAMIRNVRQMGWFVSEGEDAEAVLTLLRAETRRALDKAVSLDPDNLQTLLAQAADDEAELEAEFQEERKKLLDRILAEYPDNAMAWYLMGWWQHQQGNTETAGAAFTKAIELDPLNVHFVWGTVNHHAIVGEEEKLTALNERLAQISPEAGASTGFSRTDGSIRLFNLTNAFVAEADPQILDRYGEILFDPETTFISPVVELAHTMIYWVLRNDPERILALEERLELGDSPTQFEVRLFNDMALTLANVYLSRGQGESAAYFAREVLATASLPQAEHASNRAINHTFFAGACAVLGDLDCTRRWANQLMNERNEKYNDFGLPGYAALSLFDLDQAVDLILEEKRRNPRWFGTDMVAAFQFHFPRLVLHPELMAFYQDEGKWMDYLAERIPEYAALQGGETALVR